MTLNGGFLNIDPTTSGKLTVGDLALTGTNAVRFDPAPTSGGGTFNVPTYTGALTGTLGTSLVVENAAKYRNSCEIHFCGSWHTERRMIDPPERMEGGWVRADARLR